MAQTTQTPQTPRTPPRPMSRADWALAIVVVVVSLVGPGVLQWWQHRDDGRVPVPSQPLAQCRDGTLWYGAQHRFACSHHHGVAVWYDGVQQTQRKAPYVGTG